VSCRRRTHRPGSSRSWRRCAPGAPVAPGQHRHTFAVPTAQNLDPRSCRSCLGLCGRETRTRPNLKERSGRVGTLRHRPMDTAGGGQPLPTHKKQQCVHWRSAARSFRLPLVLGTVSLLLLPGALVAMVVTRADARARWTRYVVDRHPRQVPRVDQRVRSATATRFCARRPPWSSRRVRATRPIPRHRDSAAMAAAASGN